MLVRHLTGRGSTELQCSLCGRRFVRSNAHIRTRTGNGNIYCSRICAGIGNNTQHADHAVLHCNECGKQFTVKRYREFTARFCSTACRAKAIGKEKRLPRELLAGRSYASKAAIKRAVRRIGKCEQCGSTEGLHGHHVKSHAAHLDLRECDDNIKVLCGLCHAKEHPELSAFILAPRRRLPSRS